MLRGEGWVKPVAVEFDRMDLFLPKMRRESRRLCTYILAQKPLLSPEVCFTGFFTFDDSVVGDAFTRRGHVETKEANRLFYLQPVDNLSTVEAQHAVANYENVLKVGIRGIIAEIDASRCRTRTSPVVPTVFADAGRTASRQA